MSIHFLDRGNIVRWYLLVCGINFDLDNPWLSVTPNKSFENGILVARSLRYHTPQLIIDFLINILKYIYWAAR